MNKEDPERLRFLRFRVEKLNSEDEVVDDWGIWSGTSVFQALEPNEDGDTYGFFDFNIGSSGKVIMGSGWPGERSTTVRITRLPGGTPIPDSRSWFDKILHFIFRVRWEE